MTPHHPKTPTYGLSTWIQRLRGLPWPALVALMRLDKPIGIWLLLWPTLSALWIAAEGIPSWKHLVIFSLGVVIMRSAGCVINDLADRRFDGQVKRTKVRPLATGAMTVTMAWALFGVLLFCALLLVLWLPLKVIGLSFIAVLLASLYPFMKRYTHYPQVVLGAAYSWGIPMAYIAETGHLDPVAGLLFLANLLWTIAYDTLYAMSDKEDDLKIGVKSTAIAFGLWDWPISLAIFYLALLCFGLVGGSLALSHPYWIGLMFAAIWGGWIFSRCHNRNREACLMAFRRMHWVGLCLLLGLIFSF
jgi:4-hydroxybenzoate polyprenyltransferase